LILSKSNRRHFSQFPQLKEQSQPSPPKASQQFRKLGDGRIAVTLGRFPVSFPNDGHAAERASALCEAIYAQRTLRTRLHPGHQQLALAEWTEALGSERLTGTLLGRLTHHVHILKMNGDSYCLKQCRRKRSPSPNPDIVISSIQTQKSRRLGYG